MRTTEGAQAEAAGVLSGFFASVRARMRTIPLKPRLGSHIAAGIPAARAAGIFTGIPMATRHPAFNLIHSECVGQIPFTRTSRIHSERIWIPDAHARIPSVSLACCARRESEVRKMEMRMEMTRRRPAS